MKRINLFLFLILLGSSNVFSQYSVTGKIIDGSTAQPIDFCNLILYEHEKPIRSTHSDASGTFLFDKVAKGNYTVEARLIGFTTYKTDVAVSADINLGGIELKSTAFELEGIEVVAKQRQVVYKLDKKIISAQSNILSAGGTATDILSKVPSIRVDLDGNVSFRGSSGFIVQVNGKPSMFNASQALQQIPANQIENIEIITTPSARHQTDGDAGIINIITKRAYGEGLSGAVNLFTDLYGSRGADFTLNKQSGEHRFKLGGMYGQRIRKSDFEQEKGTLVADTSIASHSKGPRQGEHYSYILQAGWELEKKHTTYYVELTGGYEGWTNQGDLRYSETIYKPHTPTLSNEYRSKDFYDLYETILAGNMGFNHTFAKEGHTLKGYFYLKYGANAMEKFTSDLFDENKVRQQGHKAWEDEHRWTIDGRLDYVLPYSSSGRMETGYQYYSYLEDGDYKMKYWNPSTKEFYERDDIYNTFYFQRGVHTLYVLLNQQIAKFVFQAGARAEHTHQVLRSSKTWANRTENRLEFFPSAHIGYNPDETTTFTLAYSRRTNRPELFYMEPYITFRDYYTAEIGNPDIRPEYINSFELTFKKNINEHTIQAAVFHRNRTNKIERLRIPYEAGITLDSMANVGNDYSTGMELGLNMKVNKMWDFTFNGDLYHYKIKNKLGLGNGNASSVNYGLALNNNFQLTSTTSLQLDGTFIGPTVRTQGTQKGFFYADLGLRQQLFKGKIIAGLSFRNFAHTAKYINNIANTEVSSYTKILPKYPLITFSIGYTFNNFKQRVQGRNGSDFFEGTNF